MFGSPLLLAKAVLLLSLCLLLLQLTLLLANLESFGRQKWTAILSNREGNGQQRDNGSAMLLEAESQRIVAEDGKNDGAADWTEGGGEEEGDWRVFGQEMASVQWLPDLHISSPLENSCKLPLLEPTEPDLLPFVRHFRQAKCPPPPVGHLPLVSQLPGGQLLFGVPHRANLSAEAKLACFVRPLGGTLRPRVRRVQLLGANWTRIPVNRILEPKWEQFVVKCFDDQQGKRRQLVFQDAFATIVPRPKPAPQPAALSNDGRRTFGISLFVVDSMARSQFLRHLPLCAQFLMENGFRLMSGYTKVGDNSAINLLAVLAGMVYQPLERGFEPGWFVNNQSVLSEQTIRDGRKDFWQRMHSSLFRLARMAGYASLWNDDIATSGFGLFHYNTFRGFLQPPADHYFRPFYEYVYQRLGASSGCLNGQLAARRYIDIWERFASKYADRPQLALNFLTGLTHASANNLELLDEPLNDALGRLKASGHLERNFVLLMGDHGQRISAIQNSRSGRVEERMPLLAIGVPPAFARQWPDQADWLAHNQNRLLSNFDLFQTLADILLLSSAQNHSKLAMAIARAKNSRPGLSLFAGPVPAQRNCRDARIPKQFCCCMEQQSGGDSLVQRIDALLPRLQSLLFAHFRNSSEANLDCLQGENFRLWTDAPGQFRIYRLNEQTRAGIRSPGHLHKLAAQKGGQQGWQVEEDVFELEMNATLATAVRGHRLEVAFLVRVGWHLREMALLLRAEPLVLGWHPPVPGTCSAGRPAAGGQDSKDKHILTLEALCRCFAQGNGTQKVEVPMPIYE